MEYPEVARQDVQELLERFRVLEVRESFSDYMKRAKRDENAEMRIIKKAPLIELTLEEMDSSLMLDDVGGLSGFADFLGVIYEGEDKEEASSARVWVKSLGWSATKVSNKMML